MKTARPKQWLLAKAARRRERSQSFGKQVDENRKAKAVVAGKRGKAS